MFIVVSQQQTESFLKCNLKKQLDVVTKTGQISSATTEHSN